MPIERELGDSPDHTLEVPVGCAGISADALSRCTAELSGEACHLCRRIGHQIPAVEWDGGPGYNVIGTTTIQAIRVRDGHGPWVVVVFGTGRRIHPDWPAIACGTKERAIALAHARAKQIGPRLRTSRHGKDADVWRRGGILIVVAEPG